MSDGVTIKNSASARGGVGFCGLLTIVFVALKLLHVINWSWVWVLAPIWIPVVAVIAYLIFLAVIVSRINK